jgi:hypothetical protein
VFTEWYPPADNSISELTRRLGPTEGIDFLMGSDPSMSSLMGSIAWNDVKVQPGATADFPVERQPSRYYAARGTDASPLTAGGQHEKFLFYRGVGRFPIPLSARVSGSGDIEVENRGSDLVPSVILFENREGRIGYRLGGGVRGHVTLHAPALDGSLPQLREELETDLVRQGLFPKEAHAMVETWRDSWFEEGSRLIYIVPPAAVDAALPLHVEPAPSQTARVFVGRIELIDARTQEAVKSDIARSDWSAMNRYGRFVGPILARIYAANPAQADKIEQVYSSATGSGRCQ